MINYELLNNDGAKLTVIPIHFLKKNSPSISFFTSPEFAGMIHRDVNCKQILLHFISQSKV